MNFAVLHALYVGVPLAVVAVLLWLVYSRKGNHPATYTLSERWTHEPVLWAATGESIPGDGHGHHGESGTEIVGGGASGKW